MIIMMIFNMSTLYFHKISFPYFEDYLMTKLTLGKVLIAHYIIFCATRSNELHDVPKYCACWDLSLPSGLYPRY